MNRDASMQSARRCRRGARPVDSAAAVITFHTGAGSGPSSVWSPRRQLVCFVNGLQSSFARVETLLTNAGSPGTTPAARSSATSRCREPILQQGAVATARSKRAGSLRAPPRLNTDGAQRGSHHPSLTLPQRVRATPQPAAGCRSAGRSTPHRRRCPEARRPRLGGAFDEATAAPPAGARSQHRRESVWSRAMRSSSGQNHSKWSMSYRSNSAFEARTAVCNRIP